MELLKLRKGIEPGTYRARVDRIEQVDTKYGPAFKLIYITADEMEASELVNKNYSASTKLGKRTRELLGELPTELDPNRLLGAKVVITLEQTPGSDFSKVTAVKKQPDIQPIPKAQPVGSVNEESPF